MCKGRNSLMMNVINEFIDLHESPIAPLIGKFGLISFIGEMKNMNYDMFSEINGKSLLDYAIENKNEEMILEFFEIIEEISDDLLSKYLTKILIKSFKLFDSVFNYILSEEKFSKNKLKFTYLYDKNSLPSHFKTFFNIENVDISSLDLNKIKNNCRDSVISEINNHSYKIIKEPAENENKNELNILKTLLEKNTSSKYKYYLFEHDVQKLIKIFNVLKNYNLFLPHKIVKSKNYGS